MNTNRTLGLIGATGIGVGAMVGGGILALAGVAFAATGPSAILAFALNGFIAFLTILSFAEMAAANPQSGGVYTYAKKALTVQVAFGAGWVVWFASLVASVLYALGFGAFAVFAIAQILGESSPDWLMSGSSITVLALMALAFYALKLTRSSAGGGALANIGKLVVFGILVAGGLAALVQTPVSHVRETIQPFFAEGFTGLIAAMGYTFIALQGFDLIASASGEIKEPEKNIPRAMIATLVIGLAIYLPLLFVIMTVGMQPGESIQVVSEAYPETVVAIAAQNYLGAFGFWLVMIAGILAMLSALQANMFAASRIALAMAVDRTLKHHLSYIHKKYGTPVAAIGATAGIAGILILVLPDVAAAGAASSLIFLLTFALAHGISILMRKRSFSSTKTFRSPFFPMVPIVGMLACFGLAAFQAIAEPAAGIITLIWLFIGSVLFVVFFLQRARVIDASAEALDPDLIRLRGLSPLVLVPIANPANATSMVFVANALAPPLVGRVLLLSIVIPTEDRQGLAKRLENNKNAVHQALTASFVSGLHPDALTTIAHEPWQEIMRVVKEHRCRSMLLGLSSFSELETTQNLEKLVQNVKCDVVVFRQPFSGWKITDVKRILVPVGGLSDHDALRARVLGSLWRANQPEITFIQIVREDTPEEKIKRNEKNLKRFTGRIIPGPSNAEIIKSNDVTGTLIRLTRENDLIVMGLGKTGPKQRAFGHITLALAKETDTAMILISHKL